MADASLKRTHVSNTEELGIPHPHHPQIILFRHIPVGKKSLKMNDLYQEIPAKFQSLDPSWLYPF